MRHLKGPGARRLALALLFVLTGSALSSCSDDDNSTQPDPAPAAPTNLEVTRGDGDNAIEWPAVAGATTYNLYWADVTGGSASYAMIADVESPFIHSGLTNGREYSYFLTAENSSGESEESTRQTAVPFDGPCSDSSGNRFVDCGNGTITDTETGLIWMKVADCFDPMMYADAEDAIAQLASGDCGLSDHSQAGDWRIPTGACPATNPNACVFYPPGPGEIIITGEYGTILSNNAACLSGTKVLDTAGTGCWSDGSPFTGIRTDSSGGYWTSSPSLTDAGQIYRIHLDGSMSDREIASPTELWRVWAVRN